MKWSINKNGECKNENKDFTFMFFCYYTLKRHGNINLRRFPDNEIKMILIDGSFLCNCECPNVILKIWKMFW